MPENSEGKPIFERDQVVSIINSVISKVGAANTEFSNDEIYKELKGLKAIIREARKDLNIVKAGDINDKHIPTATDELDEVVAATAEATGSIMDACEAIEEAVESDKNSASEAVIAQVTNIYEACSFQDITGQRITKVVQTLKDIEGKVNQLVDVLGQHPDMEDEDGGEEEEGETGDAALLNGPQMSGNAISQDEIDKLLADFD